MRSSSIEYVWCVCSVSIFRPATWFFNCQSEKVKKYSTYADKCHYTRPSCIPPKIDRTSTDCDVIVFLYFCGVEHFQASRAKSKKKTKNPTEFLSYMDFEILLSLFGDIRFTSKHTVFTLNQVNLLLHMKWLEMKFAPKEHWDSALALQCNNKFLWHFLVTLVFRCCCCCCCQRLLRLFCLRFSWLFACFEYTANCVRIGKNAIYIKNQYSFFAVHLLISVIPYKVKETKNTKMRMGKTAVSCCFCCCSSFLLE